MEIVLPSGPALLKFIVDQIEDTARECCDLRAAERLRMLVAEIKRRTGRA
jgi:hypothetical protein